jgi:hypothetical protein
MQKKKNHETQYPWRCRPSRSAYRRLHRPSKRSATRAPNYVARICQAASLLRRLLSQRMALRVKYLWAKGRPSDSGDPSTTSHIGVLNTVFRQPKGVDIAMRSISELNPHGLLTHCVRFAPTSCPVNGNTRYRPARYRFDRAGLAPAGRDRNAAHAAS